VRVTTDIQNFVEHLYDGRGYRIQRKTTTSGSLTEDRHYYYTPGWQCVEERLGSATTVERQFVWGLRYIDDLVFRDRSTANNGTINERRYAMQDGNWNTVAICDTTGSVTERYAYSAYGAPVFMTGAGTVQASSPIGFETLYAGYRWDGATPQMYYVRNRFLLPVVGTWNRRDPLGYVDGMNFSEYCISSTVTMVDPSGTQQGPVRAPGGTQWSTGGFQRGGNTRLGGRTWPQVDPPPSEGLRTETHPPTYATEPLYNRSGLFQSPNGESLIPYWQEDYPIDRSFWSRNRLHDPRLPSRYNSFGSCPRLQGEMSISAAPGCRPNRPFQPYPPGHPYYEPPICSVNPLFPSVMTQPAAVEPEPATEPEREPQRRKPVRRRRYPTEWPTEERGCSPEDCDTNAPCGGRYGGIFGMSCKWNAAKTQCNCKGSVD